MKLLAESAFDNRRRNTHSRWSPGNVTQGDDTAYSVASERAFDKAGVSCNIKLEPRFVFDRSATVFTIGSCFARNIERHLIAHGVEVLSRLEVESRLLKAMPGDPSGFLNKFTTGSILSELEIAAGQRRSGDSIYEGNDGEWWNSLIRLAAVGARADALQLRGLVDEMYSRVERADVVIVTLGLIESWIDTETGLGLNGPPPPPVDRRYPGRFQFVRTGVESNIGDLDRIVGLLGRLAPAARIVLTVSPVPLGATFTEDDIIVANSLSKSTLRAAIAEIVGRHPGCDYFPSYEMVMWGNSAKVWAADKLHVRDKAVEEITGRFIASYIS